MTKVKSKKDPKISVIIPSFNKARYIEETINSILMQNYPNLEIIIQDGGSNDGTADIIKKFADKYPNIISFVSKPDGGQLDAVKKGMTKATGEILTFINADDCYFPSVFKSIADAYNKYPKSLWFVGGGIVINDKNKEIAKPVTMYKEFLRKMNIYPLLLTNNYIMQPSVFFTKEAYDKYGPFTGTPDFITEYDFWLTLGKFRMPVLINKNISRFRIEPNTKTKRLFNPLLQADESIVRKYSRNIVILGLHRLNNLGRMVVGRFV